MPNEDRLISFKELMAIGDALRRPITETTPAKALTSSELVGVWEAALNSTVDAVGKTPLRGMENSNWEKARIAMKALDEIVGSLRRQTPTVGTEGRSEAQPS